MVGRIARPLALGLCQDWWYDLLSNALFYGVCDVFFGVEGAKIIQRSIAKQLADSVLNGNYDYHYCDYA
jgi:hypothetical protein